MKCFHFPQIERKENIAKGRKSAWWSSFSSNESRRSRLAKSSHSYPEMNSSSTISRVADSSHQNNLRIFSLRELKAATRNFYVGNFLGEGGFGQVYRGWIKICDSEEAKQGKLEVAIKQMNPDGRQGHKEWLSEIKFLGLASHPNLVKLMGYCVEDDDKGLHMLLVYEYMPNKSLEAHLFGPNLPVLRWESRVKIALGAAQGLAYLHEEMELQIIYRDFKTANILLDNDLKPKLSDFGLARQGPDVGASHVTTAVVGTMGYAAPEYVHTGRLTSKSDVWSYGMVLLELLTGRKALNTNLPKNEQWLLDWAKPNLCDVRKLQQIMDPRLSGQYSLQAAEKVMYLASRCLSKSAKSRPKMSKVVEELKVIIEMTESQDQAKILESPVTQEKIYEEESLNPRQIYALFKEEMNLKRRDNRQLPWRKLYKHTVIEIC